LHTYERVERSGGLQRLDALQLVEVSHDEIVASVLQQLLFEMLWRM